jgi:hypothetical protein
VVQQLVEGLHDGRRAAMVRRAHLTAGTSHTPRHEGICHRGSRQRYK